MARARNQGQPWWHAHIGLVWSLAGAIAAWAITTKADLARVQAQVETQPMRRDREIDQLIDRVHALEELTRRCIK